MKKLKDFNTCDNFKFDKSDFKIEQLIGKWTPVMKSKEIPIFTACESINFLQNEKELKAEIVNRKSNTKGINIKLDSSKMKNSFSFSYLGISNVLTVLDTDYSNYAILYTCTDLSLFKLYNVVILSKTIDVPEVKVNEYKSYIQKTIGKKNLVDIDQKNC